MTVKSIGVSYVRLPTGNYQCNLLRHGSSQLIRCIASIFTLELGEVLVVKHKSARCLVCFICYDVRRDKVFAIFCPSVSEGTKHLVGFLQLISDRCSAKLKRCFFPY